MFFDVNHLPHQARSRSLSRPRSIASDKFVDRPIRAQVKRLNAENERLRVLVILPRYFLRSSVNLRSRLHFSACFSLSLCLTLFFSVSSSLSLCVSLSYLFVCARYKCIPRTKNKIVPRRGSRRMTRNSRIFRDVDDAKRARRTRSLALIQAFIYSLRVSPGGKENKSASRATRTYVRSS